MTNTESESGDKTKHMILPSASEEVINVDEGDVAPGYAERMQPLLIETAPRHQSTPSHTDRADRRYQNRHKRRKESDKKPHGSTGALAADRSHQRRAKTPEGYPTDQQSQRTNKSRTHPSTKTYGSLLGGPTVEGKWRYSNIFAPDPSRKYKRTPTQERSRSFHAQSSPSLFWPPYVTVPLLPYIYDPKCNPPIRSLSQAELQSYPLDGHTGIPMAPTYPPELQHTPQHWHKSKSMPSTYWKTNDVPSHGVFIADHDGYRIEPMDLPGYNEFEIEYATLDKNDGESYLSKSDLNAIVQLARKCSEKSDSLDKVAKAMSKGLDEQLEGGKWHVVVSDKDYGSHIASVPGALAKFLVGKLAFLVWQT